MFYTLFTKILFSLLSIILIHQIYIFLKDTLTTPKIKDLVKKPMEQYKDIYESIKSQDKDTTKHNTPQHTVVGQKEGKNENNTNQNNMKDDLHNFLDTLSKNTPNTKHENEEKHTQDFNNPLDFSQKNDTDIISVGNDINSNFSSF
jgi:hypothetical protein